MYLNTGPSYSKYIKTHCPNYKADMIIHLNKMGYSSMGFVIVKNGRPVQITTSNNSESLDIEIPKLIEYFYTGNYDTNKYYQFYIGGDYDYATRTITPKQDLPGIFRFEQPEHMQRMLKIRREHGEAGLHAREVARPTAGTPLANG